MSLAGDIAEIAAQLAVLLIFSGGGGCWLWLATGRPPGGRSQSWLGFALAGFALSALLLQSLVYAGVPLAVSTGPVLLLAVAGMALVATKFWRNPASPPIPAWRDAKACLFVMIVAMVGQAPGLLATGPDRFYGTAKNDQANYVMIAELLLRTPFGISENHVGYRPWMERAIDMKEDRITQSVLVGAVAAGTKTSAQEAYGAVNLFLAALAAAAVTAWIRAESASRFVACCAGLAMALAPAVTRIYLEGFLSQVGSLFVYPALALVLGRRGPLRREAKVIGTILLAYLVGIYTEVAVFGFILAAALILCRPDPWRARVSAGFFMGTGALLLNPGYSTRLIDFALTQWRIGSNPNNLSALFPDSGTLLGWGRLFFDFRWQWLTAGAGLLVVALVAWGAVTDVRRRRYTVAVATAIGAAPLVVLGLLPHSSGYVFAKLCIQFLPVWIVGAFLGLTALTRTLRRRARWPGVATGAWVGATALAAFPYHQQVIHPSGLTAELSSSRLRSIRREAEAHPERAYLVACDEPNLAQWLCYFGRESDVVVDRRTVGDQILTTEAYAARRWSERGRTLYWLDLEKNGPVAGYEPPPALVIRGAQESGGEGATTFHAAGETLDFVFQRPSGSQTRPVWLDFVVVPWTHGGSCHLEMETSGGVRAMEVNEVSWCRWPLALGPGTTVRRLRLRAADQVAGNPAAIIRLVSVESSPVLPPWQRVTEAGVPGGQPRER